MVFNELKGAEPIFKEEYFKNMVPRFVNASLNLEGLRSDYSDVDEALMIFHNTQALEYALSPELDGNISKEIIVNIEKKVTNEAYVDFRKIDAEVNGSSVKRSRANMIHAHLNELFYDYKEDGKYLDDPFLREAKFHIRFLHIHPFGDGNGRTARVLLIKNLCSQGLAPCIITEDIKDEYCSYIENADIFGLAELFRKRSEKEKRFMVELYNNLNSRSLIEGSKMTNEQAIKYKKITDGDVSDDLIANEEEKYPLRNVDNLVSIFKYRSLPKTNTYNLNYKPIHSLALHIYDHIEDFQTGDVAMYSEETKTMIIQLFGDNRFFKISQLLDQLKFEVEGVELPKEAFGVELKNTIKLDDDTKKLVK